ncbi:riboflavine-aldehyde-forming enzyme [Cerioporus squamosus]|nr:riboflavine-aldehyde-forming enzyme [Cerioporus squamosus]
MFSKTTILALVSAAFTLGVHAGTATYYQPNGGFGACGAPSQNSDFVVALSPSEYAGGANCWRHIGVWCMSLFSLMSGQMNSRDFSDQGRFVDVTVVDECPGCEPGHIDLSEGAFQQLASLDAGLIQVDYNYE